VTYNETTKALWRLIGEDVRISVWIEDPQVPAAGPVASFAARLDAPPEWAGTGWRPLYATTPEGDKPATGPGHITASLSPSDFIEGKLIHDGGGVEACFRGGVRVVVVKPDTRPSRVIDASALTP
jgi:hypothetical protein